MTDVQTIEVINPVDEAKAKQALWKIEKLKENLTEGMIDLAELLQEARANNYHFTYGYTRFGDWIEQGSGLDMSARTAFYLTAIMDKSQRLGIPKETLRKVKISKLKEIFTLDDSKFGLEMKLLVSTAESSSLNEVKEKVQTIAAEGKPTESFIYITLKIPKLGKEVSFDKAVELVRRNYGDVIDPTTGEVMDISTSKAIELICQEYTQNPNNFEEIVEVIRLGEES